MFSQRHGGSSIFFRQAQAVAAQLLSVTTDGQIPMSDRKSLGTDVQHRVSDCLTNRIEQDHRGIKQRYYPMLGFGAFESAKDTAKRLTKCAISSCSRMREFVSLSEKLGCL